VLNVFARAPQLDSIGRVIDFSVLKERIGGWIDAYWDHAFLVYRSDHKLIEALVALNDPHHKIVILPVNPTAENLALFLLEKVCPKVLEGTDVCVYGLELWETENCKAIVCLGSKV
jgi:6-pyruvoyltetrahydropterin/6-carboxytetrahydropterin synthase